MSNTIYIGCFFIVNPLQPATDILIAELGDRGFESFVETEDGLQAYITKREWKPEILEDVYILNSEEFDIEFTFEEMKQINWNEEWEKNFDPILVDNICSIRAPFHSKPEVLYDIIIEPKMSFGTGHHETTYMMVQQILNSDFTDKIVLDIGCGTGILAILAELKGASSVDAIDIDNWCYINTKENIERNECEKIDVYEGDAALLKGKQYDIIIANINRNILLNDISKYVASLNKQGIIFVSGFYRQDLSIIKSEFAKHHFKTGTIIEKNDWLSISFAR